MLKIVRLVQRVEIAVKGSLLDQLDNVGGTREALLRHLNEVQMKQIVQIVQIV